MRAPRNHLSVVGSGGGGDGGYGSGGAGYGHSIELADQKVWPRQEFESVRVIITAPDPLGGRLRVGRARR